MITANGNLAEKLQGTIAGVVACVPSRRVSNADIGPMAHEASRLTGVHERRVAAGHGTEHYCAAAARRLMINLGWDVGTIDALVYVTQTPGLSIPSGAFLLHQWLGLPAHVPAIEINWSCSGYVNGLWMAMKLAAPETLAGGKRVLLLVGDTITRVCDPMDRATAPLFGDCGTATAVITGPCIPSSDFVLGTDPQWQHLVQRDPHGHLIMDGPEVFNFTLKRVPPLVEDLLAAGTPDHILFHQANRFMLEHLVKKMKLREVANVPSNIERFGNTSCASIPLLLCDALGVTQARGTTLALLGYGAGWAWAGAQVDCTDLQCAELIEG